MSTCSNKKAILKKEVAKKKDGKGGPGMVEGKILPPHKQLVGRMPAVTGSGPEAIKAMQLGFVPSLKMGSKVGKTLGEFTVPGKIAAKTPDPSKQFTVQGREGMRDVFEKASLDKKKSLMKEMTKATRKANKLQNRTQGIKADLPFLIKE